MIIEPYTPEKLPIEDIDWDAHTSLIGKANQYLGRYDGIIQTIVNPDILLAPLMIKEAELSSRIEGTTVTLVEVLQYEADPKDQYSVQKVKELTEVLNYSTAMKFAQDALKNHPLSINMIKDMHRILLTNVRGEDAEPGEIRRVQNYIRLRDKKVFTPPQPQQVMDALTDWESYLYKDDRDPLVQLAVLKAQFELIHPFRDGNGRIGRMLVPLILHHKGHLSNPTFYISAFLERNRPVYLDRLEDISQKGDWNGWISFFLEAITEQAKENSQKAMAIHDLYRKMKEEIPEIAHSEYSVQVIDTIFMRPVFSTPSFYKSLEINRVTAQRILDELTKNGILQIVSKGKARRPTIYSFPELLEITRKM